MNHTSRMTTTTQSISRLQPWMVPETTWGWYTTSPTLETLAAGYAPIGLKQMDSVALLNRTDTKFVMSHEQLFKALSALQHDYWMLSVYCQRLSHYRTLYFDTPGFDLYNLHVNDRAERYKVRSREYTDSSLSFLEVKHKTRKGRTIKDRVLTAQPVVEITREAENWLHGVFPFECQALEPKLWNTFTRITLVSKQCCERVTLDVDLTFYTADHVVQLDGIAVAEVKMDKNGRLSPFLAQMRAQRIHPRGFSKYCLGVSMLYDHVKKNALKPKMLWVEKMIKGAANYE